MSTRCYSVFHSDASVSFIRMLQSLSFGCFSVFHSDASVSFIRMLQCLSFSCLDASVSFIRMLQCLSFGCFSVFHSEFSCQSLVSLSRCYIVWLRLVGSLKLHVSFAEYSLFYRALLQKRLIILRSLLILATPYQTLVFKSCVPFFCLEVC